MAEQRQPQTCAGGGRKGWGSTRLVPSGSEHHEENTRDAANVNRRQISKAAAVEEEDTVALRQARAARSGVPCKQPCRARAWPLISSICTSWRDVPGSPTELHTEQIKQ